MSDSTSATPTVNGSAPRAWPLVRRFWPWARPHRRYTWTIFGLLLLSTPLALVSPLIVRRVVDDAVERSSPDEVLYWGLVLIAMTVLSVLLGLGIGYAAALFHNKVLRDLRVSLYLHMQSLSLRYYNDKETGWLMSRQMDDVDNLEGVMADTFARAAVDVVRGLGYVGMIFYIEWRMASGGLLLAVMIFGFQFLISPRLRLLSKTTREQWTTVSQSLHQSLSGHRLVQATASERRESLRFMDVLHASVRAQVRRDMFSLWTSNVFSLIGGVAPTIIVLGGVYLIVTSDFTVGGLFAFFMYLMQMFGSVGRLTRLNPRLQQSLASLERIYEVLDTTPEIVLPPAGRRLDRIEGTISFDQVEFEYVAGQPVLRRLDLRVEARTMVALVGRSGAGKTTLASLVPRFYDPTHGQVHIDGVDLREFDLRWYRGHVGLVPQEIFLFDRSVTENIAYGSKGATLQEIRRAADAANALEFIERMPEGFETLIGERGVKLSGGQRQRLVIAREILRDPEILILDEATSSLDSQTEALIQQALGTLLQGRTSIVIAHRLSTVARADVIVVMDDGRITEIGRHDELLASDGLYASLYRSQFLDAARSPD